LAWAVNRGQRFLYIYSFYTHQAYSLQDQGQPVTSQTHLVQISSSTNYPSFFTMGDIPPPSPSGPPHQQHANLRATLPVPNPTTSHWQTPEHRLARHRSTPDLPSEADIVVIGSGITAAFFALDILIADHGIPGNMNMVVLEARTMCSGATGRNGGHLVVDGSARNERREWEERVWDMVAEVAVRGGSRIECEWREVRNVMGWWGWDREGWEGVKRRVQRDREVYGEQYRVVEDEEELMGLDLKGSIGAVLSGQGRAATLCPYALVCGIWEGLINSFDDGGPSPLNLQMETPVVGVERDEATGINVVKTKDRGEIRAKHVVVATNGYVSQLLEQFTGLVVPTQGQMTALKPVEQGRILKHDYGLEGLKGQSGLIEDYAVQRPWDKVGQGAIMHGGARQWVKGGGEGVSDDSYNVDEAVEWLRDLPQRIDVGADAPQLELLKAWTGVMGYSKDRAPWVGAMPGTPGVWVSAGYTGHGMTNAPGCGRHLGILVSAALRGEDWKEAERKSIADGTILQEFVISEERIAKAKLM
jgi:glycine/D-amino acid oxidase-like deaminating enzyme